MSGDWLRGGLSVTYEASTHRYVYKWRAACSLLQQTKRPFIRLDPHSLVGDLGVPRKSEEGPYKPTATIRSSDYNFSKGIQSLRATIYKPATDKWNRRDKSYEFKLLVSILSDMQSLFKLLGDMSSLRCSGERGSDRQKTS